MSNLSPALVIPNSLLAREATGILREYSSDLLFNHSVRVYLFAAEQGRQRKLRFDAELLYIAAAFHDLGLTRKFSSENERFEVDGANAARQFLSAHNVAEEQVRTVWEAIALHTTPGITHHMQPEVALLYTGVGLDVLGRGFDQFPADVREQIVAQVPAQALQGRLHKGVLRRLCAQASHHVRHRERRRLRTLHPRLQESQRRRPDCLVPLPGYLSPGSRAGCDRELRKDPGTSAPARRRVRTQGQVLF